MVVENRRAKRQGGKYVHPHEFPLGSRWESKWGTTRNCDSLIFLLLRKLLRAVISYLESSFYGYFTVFFFLLFRWHVLPRGRFHNPCVTSRVHAWKVVVRAIVTRQEEKKEHEGKRPRERASVFNERNGTVCACRGTKEERNTREGSWKLRKRVRTLLYGETEGKSYNAITRPLRRIYVVVVPLNFVLFLALLSFIRARSVVRTRNQPVFSASVLPQSISGS